MLGRAREWIVHLYRTILGRDPNDDEVKYVIQILLFAQSNTEEIRRSLMHGVERQQWLVSLRRIASEYESGRQRERRLPHPDEVESIISPDDIQKLFVILAEIQRVQRPSRPLIEFRTFCADRLLPKLREMPVCLQAASPTLEVVIIEFRALPHLEAILRNAIRWIGPTRRYTLAGGLLNAVWRTELAASVHAEVHIVTFSDIAHNPTRDDYNRLLLQPRFWKAFEGDKILIVQEDSLIFREGIDAFLQYDYIGAPWYYAPMPEKPTARVGNGGFSLRTKQVMLDTLDKYESFVNLQLSSSEEDIPEDVFFSTHCTGHVAPKDVAASFSVEYVQHAAPFGGHQFWMADAYAKKMRDKTGGGENKIPYPSWQQRCDDLLKLVTSDPAP